MNTLSNVPLHYPSARDWMWNYCIYLGPFTDTKGYHYDLGIHIDDLGEISAAIVCGHDPGDYFSGDLINRQGVTRECYDETLKRAMAIRII